MWAAESSEEILQSIVGAEGSNNWQAVANFIEGASVFAVSRLWSDLIAAFGFGLQPIPYCGSFLEAPCTPTAPSGDLFLYALGCVPAAALAKHLAEYFLPERGLYGCLKKLVPTMSAYVVGWAVGGAFLQMLKELEADHPELCDADGSGCSLLSLLFAVMVTFISAIIVIGLQPLTQSVECGDGKVLDFIEDFLEDLWALVSRGASATSMVLWYHFASTLESVGMEDTSGFAKLKLLVVFTGLVFFVGAFISVKLEQMEEHCARRRSSRSRGEARPSASPTSSRTRWAMLRAS